MASEGADLKSLELLFDYTKFHIGFYLTLAVSYIAVATLKVGDKFILEVDRRWLWAAVIAIALAGFSGGVIASSITQCECRSSARFLTQDIGPYGFRWGPAQWWTYFEHTAFWIGIICALLSFRAANRKNRLNSQLIARRAYELYEKRGHTDGSDIDDWLQAEREIKGSDCVRKKVVEINR